MEEIKQVLMQEKAQLMADIEEQHNQDINSDHDVGDPIDESVEEQEREFKLLLQDRERNKLLKIEDALRRMAIGDYGFCDECGEEIGKKRLMALPFTRYCVFCQETMERGTARNANTFEDSRNFGED
ncbi:MAG: TraR/DksA family transcriptional regulator [SAR324 cluster bacterium]|nr:TraR/DksA family transcriptional regulator [SAR324 cluster bacterium]